MSLFSYLKAMWDLASRGELEGIWFWVCVYAFVACAYSVIYQIRVRGWLSTTGLLNHATVAKFGATNQNPSEQSYHADACYTYMIQGQEYSGRRVSSWVILSSNNFRALLNHQLKGIHSSASGQVTVFYNPKKPKKSYLMLPSKLGVGFTSVMGMLPSIAYFFRYYF